MITSNGIMSSDPSVPIPSPSIVETLRTSKMKPLGALGVQSGIDKQPRTEPVFASITGLTEDEHDLTFHGGVDKAIHQYSSDNYPLWRDMFPDPDISAKFVPGGFGENIAAHGMTERNMCIGDVVRIGPAGSAKTGSKDGVLLEISLPRQPCFKLNQRFQIKNFAPKTIELARTGWYYRVLEEGYIQPGDEIKVISRPHPRWTIERLQHYLHKAKNVEMMKTLIEVPQMGGECVGNLKMQMDKIQKANAPKSTTKWAKYKIITKESETHKVMRVVLEALGKPMKKTELNPGSHVSIRLPNGLSRSYSIVGGTADRFELGVAREENSRGGSAYIHNSAQIGDIWECGAITQSLIPSRMASKHILVAGGIGITAFPAMVELMGKINMSYELHYAIQSEDDLAYGKVLDKFQAKYQIYDRSKGQRLNIRDIIKNRLWNSHVMVCGPERMINDVIVSAKAEGMADEEIHYEKFRADVSGDPFKATVIEGKRTVDVSVGEEESLLEIIRQAGFECGSSCEVGNCGTCRVEVKSGEVEHRGSALTEEEKATTMLSCVSRGVGHITVELS